MKTLTITATALTLTLAASAANAGPVNTPPVRIDRHVAMASQGGCVEAARTAPVGASTGNLEGDGNRLALGEIRAPSGGNVEPAAPNRR